MAQAARSRSTSARAPRDPITTLPFVINRRNPKTGFRPGYFWSVVPSGDFASDTARGAECARLAITAIRSGCGPGLLQDIVASMRDAGSEHDALVLGFMSEIEDALRRRIS